MLRSKCGNVLWLFKSIKQLSAQRQVEWNQGSGITRQNETKYVHVWPNWLVS